MEVVKRGSFAQAHLPYDSRAKQGRAGWLAGWPFPSKPQPPVSLPASSPPQISMRAASFEPRGGWMS